MGIIVRLDDRGRIVIPSEFRRRLGADYMEVREDDGKLVLIPVSDPLHILMGRVSRARPLRGLSEVAEEEAERALRE
ncbi:MAG: AbrB/MazE/SpoVT family DNA-binding domain-containing protein [Candidatus Bathyarchaeia archaeon]